MLLPSGDVACSPADLDLSPPTRTCSASGAGAGAVDPGDGDEAEGGVPACSTGDPGDGADGGAVAGSSAFDHVYPGRGGGGGGGGDCRGGAGACSSSLPDSNPTAILYGVVGSPTMMAFHRVLKPAAEVGTVRYVFRHALPYNSRGGDDQDSAAMTTPLQGFGVVLDVKNMEYQSFDSSDQGDEVCGSERVRVCVSCVRCECVRAGETDHGAVSRKRGATRMKRIESQPLRKTLVLFLVPGRQTLLGSKGRSFIMARDGRLQHVVYSSTHQPA